MKAIKPKILAFEITKQCRFNCIHCRASAAKDMSSQLTADQCKCILKSIADFTACTIILTGGEPMERPDIYELASYGTSLGLKMVLATCGYLIDAASAARLKNAGILAISFSLDGAAAQTHDAFRQTPGAFDAVIKAAHIVRQTDIRFQINTTVTQQNINELEAIAALAENLGAYCFNPFILVPTGRGQKLISQILTPSEYSRILEQLWDIKQKSGIEVRVTCGPQFARIAREKHKTAVNRQSVVPGVKGCLGAREFGFISCDGDVQMCGFLPLSAGNLIENAYDFAGIWRHSPLLKQIRDVKSYKGNCGLCEYAALCGGCRARAFALTGYPLEADFMCEYQPKKLTPE